MAVQPQNKEATEPARATPEFVRERLYSSQVKECDLELVLNGLSHSPTQRWLDAVIFWLDLVGEWSDADFAAPDWMMDEFRSQNELPGTGIPTLIGSLMEKTEALFNALLTAGRLIERYEREVGEPFNENVRALGVTLWIEGNKSERGGEAKTFAPQSANPKCPQCKGPTIPNDKKKPGTTAPDFVCSDENCLNEKGYRSGAWHPRKKAS